MTDRPWKQRADELEAKDGIYADYCAWEEWFQRELGDDNWETWEALDAGNKCYVYSISCKLFELGCDTSKAELAEFHEMNDGMREGFSERLAEVWGDEGVFRRCRDWLRKLVQS